MGTHYKHNNAQSNTPDVQCLFMRTCVVCTEWWWMVHMRRYTLWAQILLDTCACTYSTHIRICMHLVDLEIHTHICVYIYIIYMCVCELFMQVLMNDSCWPKALEQLLLRFLAPYVATWRMGLMMILHSYCTVSWYHISISIQQYVNYILYLISVLYHTMCT
jgi:hypothetical protein